MSDPSADLQRAIVAQVKAELAGAPLSGRIYDRVPPERSFPYVEIGEFQPLEDSTDCTDGSETFIDLHIWSRTVASVEVKRIGGALRSALNRADLDLGDDHALIELQVQGARYFRDPDGVSHHGVLTLRALTQAV